MTEDKPRILVVDDDESTRTTLALIFGEKGYQTETAGTGQAALEKAGEHFFNLALLDIKLPDMSGLDVLARLKEAHPDMVMVMATAYASLETAVQALHEGASAYVTKPLNMDEVLATVRQALEQQRLAVENRQLLEALQRELAEREHAEERVRRLLDQQTAVNQLALRLGEFRDLDEIYQTIYEHVRALMDADAFIISFYDHERRLIRAGYVMTLGVVRDITRFPPIPLEEEGFGIQSQVIRTGRPLYVPDCYEAMKRTRTLYDIREDGTVVEGPPPPEEKDTSTNSALYVPMKVEGQTIGVLQVQSNCLDAYTREDMDLLTGLANVAAISIENARLFEQARRRAAHLEALNAIIAAAAGASDLPGLLETTLDYTLRALGLEMGAIWLTDQPGMPARVQVLRGFPPEFEREMGREMAQAAPPIWRSILDPQPVADWRAETQNKVQSTLAPIMDRFGIRASLVVPIVNDGQRLGGLSMTSPSPHEWSPEEIALAEAVGRQIGAAAERARLLAGERRRRELLDTLYHLSKQLIATDELEDVMHIIARHAGEAVHVTFCRIVVLERDAFICRAAHPTRVLNRDLGVGQPDPPPAWSFYQRVLSEREPLLLSQDDPALSDDERPALLLDVAQTLCLCPLRAGDDEIGVLVLGEERGPAREPFGSDKLRLAGAIADIAASALHRAMLHRQTRQRLERLDALRTIDTTITASLDLEVILNVLLDQVTERLNVDAADVLLFDPNTLGLEFVAGRGVDSRASGRTGLRLEECLAGRAVLERHTIADLRLQVSDWESEWPEISNLQPVLSLVEVSEISNLQSEGFVAYSAAPLIAKGEVKGVLELFHREPLYPDPEWVNFVESVAAQAAIAIDNIEMFRNLQRSHSEITLAYDHTLAGWARALELRDAETEGHSRRVTDMTLNLARAMGLSDEELVHIRRGALLHDIGKMGIPDSILAKPGKLDDDEWDIVRLHPVHAFEMLSPVPYLRPALDIPYCHHERWDGTGYPRRLKGAQIPLPARIFAVVDVYDALSTDRPYRKAWPREKVLAHIREEAGKHFDPEVVEVFLGLLEGQ
ncbi:MAG: GAF domain-containing protein [Anaerolineae bacterium]